VPVAGGLASQGLRYTAAIAAEAIQVFVSNPRAWALSAGEARSAHSHHGEIWPAIM
jgi:deoxyribonuclease IV